MQENLIDIYKAYDALSHKDYSLAVHICDHLLSSSVEKVIRTHASKLVSYISRIENIDFYIQNLLKTNGTTIADADLYAAVSELIFYNNMEFADKFVDLVINRNILSKDEISIGTVRRILASAKNTFRKIDQISLDNNLERLFLKERIAIGPIGRINDIDLPWGDYDHYVNYESSNSFTSFDSDFLHESKETIATLRSKGFSTKIPTDSLHKIYYGESVRVCSLEADMYAVFDRNNTYTRSASGRLSKIIPLNVSHWPRTRISKAIFLPVPHAIDNYYHIMAEMVYPLRFAAMIDNSIPIIYSEDRLNILPFFAEKLGINVERLLSFEKVRDYSVDAALIIDKGSHYLGQDFFRFFNWSLNKGRASYDANKIVYISRSRSRRGFKGEVALEQFLEKRGVRIVYAEHMSISEQVRLFESVGCVIAPHGAGITNILFSDERVKLLEIFSKNFINPDFYLRSRQIRAKYGAFILDDDDFLSVEKFSLVFDRLVSE